MPIAGEMFSTGGRVRLGLLLFIGDAVWVISLFVICAFSLCYLPLVAINIFVYKL